MDEIETTCLPRCIKQKEIVYQDRNQKIQRIVTHFLIGLIKSILFPYSLLFDIMGRKSFSLIVFDTLLICKDNSSKDPIVVCPYIEPKTKLGAIKRLLWSNMGWGFWKGFRFI